jgi:hypothetical protein
VPANEHKFWREYGLGLMTQPINNIYENEVWHKIFIAVTVIEFKKIKPNNIKCGGYCTISPIAHTAKSVARALREMIARNT